MYIHLLQLGRVPYAEALDVQARVVAARKAGAIGDTLLLLEHPPVITLGRNSSRANILASDEFLAARNVTLHEINRGGDVTYHGPGQLVGYPIFDLHGPWPGKRGPFLGPVDFVRLMEEALIRTCADFGVMAQRIPGCTGVWSTSYRSARASRVNAHPTELRAPSNQHQIGRDFSPGTQSTSTDRGFSPCDMPSGAPTELCSGGKENKLAAIGVHVSQGVTSHGFALNVTTDLRDFQWIVPCGITDRGVTSLELESPHSPDPDRVPTMSNAADSAARSFGRIFQRQVLACPSLDELLASPRPSSS